ncbi:phosphoglycerate dehydrogenase [Candidatus Pacearchaeota archaeon]|nr:phosphoglycerate dehydrogenase [Candidatus Pacearchaeota archaeon]
MQTDMKSSWRVLISTHPFGLVSSEPLDLLRANNCEIVMNPYGRKFRPEEERKQLKGIDGLVAGTELLDETVLEHADRLRVISRVGVGLDGIDFDYAREKGIVVTYTPHAPALAVAELTICLILDLLRMVTIADRNLRKGQWQRYTGHRLRERTIGIVGIGRIGSRVAKLLSGFGCRLLGYDIEPNLTVSDMMKIDWVDFETLLKESDLITAHVPLNEQTYNMIDAKAFDLMKPDSFLVNTSRGSIVNEEALINALDKNKIAGAAIDVFTNEPYNGPLIKQKNVILTCHMASTTKESRYLMELGAVRDCLRVLKGQKPKNPVLMI